MIQETLLFIIYLGLLGYWSNAALSAPIPFILKLFIALVMLSYVFFSITLLHKKEREEDQRRIRREEMLRELEEARVRWLRSHSASPHFNDLRLADLMMAYGGRTGRFHSGAGRCDIPDTEEGE